MVRKAIGPNYFISTALKGKQVKDTAKSVITYSFADVLMREQEEMKLRTQHMIAPETRLNNMPKDLGVYIKELGDNTACRNFCILQEALKWVHLSPQTSITIGYEAEFHYKLRCQNKFPDCKMGRNYGCKCQLLYCFRKANIDMNTYIPQQFKDKEITIFSLLDYGVLSTLWVQQTDINPSFPTKLGDSIRQLYELEPYETYITCDITISSPAWINLQIKLARHLIKLQAKEIIQKLDAIERILPSIPDTDWAGLKTLGEQMIHRRTSIKGSSWLWEQRDSLEYMLIAESFTEKIY